MSVGIARTYRPVGSAMPRPRVEIGRTTLVGTLASLGMMGVFLAWAQMTPIDGAVVTPGQAVVPGKPRVVQSLDGGLTKRVLVANGDRVEAGQILLQLDPTLLQVKLDISMNRLAAALALRDRLASEQAKRAEPAFQVPVLPFAAPDIRSAEAGQRQIFAARANIRAGRRAQLTEQEAQIANQIRGNEAQTRARTEQLALIDRELVNFRALFAKSMVRESELLDLERSRAGLAGEIASDEAERARLANSVQDARIAADQADRAFYEQVSTDLRATVTEVEEQVLQIVTLKDQLARVDIRAPSAGTVHELEVTTVGGVVAPGATILQIVPQNEALQFELNLPAKDLEHVHIGQDAQLVIPTLDPRTTPRLAATVATVSPAAIVDPQTRASYYRVTLAVTPAELRRLGAFEVLPGMPIDAYLKTGARTVLSYLLAPMTHQLMRAFREE